MKTLLTLVCVVAVVFAADIPEEERRKLKEVHDACEADPKTYADEDLLRNLYKNKENKQVQVHMTCMAEKAGLLNPDNSFNEQVVKSKIGFVIQGQDNIDRVYSKCTSKKGSWEETVTCFWICLYKENTEYYHKL